LIQLNEVNLGNKSDYLALTGKAGNGLPCAQLLASISHRL